LAVQSFIAASGGPTPSCVNIFNSYILRFDFDDIDNNYCYSDDQKKQQRVTIHTTEDKEHQLIATTITTVI
jgi:hypothetical protein|tara:strand:- start:185 stop:397 length:213 start_codon:yes stop_codon:yes gene_type:complete